MSILENLLSNESDKLKSKTICYYPGSFDPPHKGHEYIAREVVRCGLCDFTLIFAVWGDDRYKKRTDTERRIEMLFALFRDDPHVIVTEYNPFQLQNALTIPIDEKFVAPKYGNKFVGLFGSDTALFYANHEVHLHDFMRGIRLKEKDDLDEVSRGDICLPIDSFIVADRVGFPFLKDKMPDGRKIIGRLDVGEKYPMSSAEIRKTLAEGKDASSVLSKSVVGLLSRS